MRALHFLGLFPHHRASFGRLEAAYDSGERTQRRRPCSQSHHATVPFTICLISSSWMLGFFAQRRYDASLKTSAAAHNSRNGTAASEYILRHAT